MDSPSRDPLRFEQIRNDLLGAYEMIGDVQTIVRRHTVTLAEHGTILAEHTVTLAEHTVTLAEHGTILAEHTVTLAEHGTKLDRVLEILEAR